MSKFQSDLFQLQKSPGVLLGKGLSFLKKTLQEEKASLLLDFVSCAGAALNFVTAGQSRVAERRMEGTHPGGMPWTPKLPNLDDLEQLQLGTFVICNNK